MKELYEKEKWFDYATMGDIKGLQACLEDKNFNIDLKDERGYTALALAMENDKRLAVEYLIKKGSNIWGKNNEGKDILEGAPFSMQYYLFKLRNNMPHVIKKFKLLSFGKDSLDISPTYKEIILPEDSKILKFDIYNRDLVFWACSILEKPCIKRIFRIYQETDHINNIGNYKYWDTLDWYIFPRNNLKICHIFELIKITEKRGGKYC